MALPAQQAVGRGIPSPRVQQGIAGAWRYPGRFPI